MAQRSQRQIRIWAGALWHCQVKHTDNGLRCHSDGHPNLVSWVTLAAEYPCPVNWGSPQSFSTVSSISSIISHDSFFLVCSHLVLAVSSTSFLRNDKWKCFETLYVCKQKFYFIFTLEWRAWVSTEFWVRKNFPSEFYHLLALLSFSLSVALRSPKPFWLLIPCKCLKHIRDSVFVESSFHPQYS